MHALLRVRPSQHPSLRALPPGTPGTGNFNCTFLDCGEVGGRAASPAETAWRAPGAWRFYSRRGSRVALPADWGEFRIGSVERGEVAQEKAGAPS